MSVFIITLMVNAQVAEHKAVSSDEFIWQIK
jgi:hypothetical protein